MRCRWRIGHRLSPAAPGGGVVDQRDRPGVGVSKNTVRAALACDDPPKCQRPAKGSIVDEVEPRIRELLRAYPGMSVTVIAGRVGWTRSIRVLSSRVAELRPAYLPPDPASRTAYAAARSRSVTCRFRRLSWRWGSGRPAGRRNCRS